MSAATRIGLGRCPVCASPKAHFTLSKKGLVCVTCNGCNFQGFARSERSDEILRGHIGKDDQVAAPPPAPAAAPAPVARIETRPSSPGEPAPTPAPARSSTEGRRSFMSW